jgi:hypothetical protein
MIHTQLLTGILAAVAALVGLAVVFAIALQATASANKPGRSPHGGIRREEPPLPQPDADDARELVLL